MIASKNKIKKQISKQYVKYLIKFLLLTRYAIAKVKNPNLK